MYQQIETERLIIRKISLADAAFMLQLVNTAGWLRFIGDRNIKNLSDSEQYLRKILDNEKYFYSVLELKPGRQPIGVITFLHREGYEHPDIGFALLPEYERNGYSYEAARSYLDEVFRAGLTGKVAGITLPDNVRSIRLLEKLGLKFVKQFVKDGETLALYETAGPEKRAGCP